jgi:hypothetical protein
MSVLCWRVESADILRQLAAQLGLLCEQFAHHLLQLLHVVEQRWYGGSGCGDEARVICIAVESGCEPTSARLGNRCRTKTQRCVSRARSRGTSVAGRDIFPRDNEPERSDAFAHVAKMRAVDRCLCVCRMKRNDFSMFRLARADELNRLAYRVRE